MNRSQKGARQIKKKNLLQEVRENDDFNDEDELLTNEEIQMMKANQKQNKSKNRVRVKSDSLVDSYSYYKKGSGLNTSTISDGNASMMQRSYISRNQQSKSRQMNRSNNISIDEDEDEEEDVLRQLNGIDVKEILEDAIKKNETNAQRRDQDFLCQVLAQMILKNKINKENAFEIPLPDVKNMSDFAKVSEASWQKLSSSLDSGSKIYGYRVDSLHQESFKMLGGLIRSEFINQNNDQQGRLEDESEDLINREREKIFKKNKKINESTIEKNIASITLNKYDIQFEVDPLFCKTSEKFDDGSSKGILLNNIRINKNLKLLIDSETFVHDLPRDSSTRNSLNRKEEVTPEKKSQTVKRNKKKIGDIEQINEKLTRENIKIRHDFNDLELCSGLEYFVNNLLSFDDSTKKFNRTFLDEVDDQEDNNSHKKLMNDIIMNENEEELINDIQTILTQTAKKGKTAMKQSQKSLVNESIDSAFESENQQKPAHIIPYNFSENLMSSQMSDFMNERVRQNEDSNDNKKMEVLNEGIQTDSNQYQQDYYTQDNDYVPHYSPTQYKQLSEDYANSKESSNGFSTSFTNTLGDFEQPDDRLFSLQNMAIRMTQIGSGQFFNQIEQEFTINQKKTRLNG